MAKKNNLTGAFFPPKKLKKPYFYRTSNQKKIQYIFLCHCHIFLRPGNFEVRHSFTDILYISQTKGHQILSLSFYLFQNHFCVSNFVLCCLAFAFDCKLEFQDVLGSIYIFFTFLNFYNTFKIKVTSTFVCAEFY